MRIDGIKLAEGSTLQNATIASGVDYPGMPNPGELFFRSDIAALHFYNGTGWVSLTSATGNAASATKLQTARRINGALFDGTQDISFTTSNVAEGTNLYFTTLRASLAAPVQSVLGRTGNVLLTVADITTTLGYTPANRAGDTFTGSITAPTFYGSLSGNASTATALETSRTINGFSFNGTQNITITTSNVAEGSNLYFTTGRASAAAPVQSVFGRTGNVALTESDISGALGFSPANKAGDTFTGNITAPTFIGALTGNALSATTATTANTATTAGNVTGTVAIANGGTGATTAVAAATNLGVLPLTGGALTGNVSVQALIEKANIVATPFTATQAIDINTAAVWYSTANATANMTLNVRASGSAALSSILAVGQSITLAVMITNGTTAYYPTVYQIDGVTVTPKWNSTAPASGSINAIDVYSITIIKTAATPAYTVLASRTKYA